MCDITIVEVNGTSDEFEAIFEDCNAEQASVQVVLLGEVPENQGGKYSIIGTATDGSPIEQEIIVPNSERINPTKVFKWVAKKLKKYLCPTCM